MKRRKKTQKQIIYEYLEKGNSITQPQAYRLFNIMRLGAIIWELRMDGLYVLSERVKSKAGKTMCKYSF